MLEKIIKKMIPNKIRDKYRTRELMLIKERIKNTECIYKLSLNDSKKLDGKIAVVTGGSGAIGSAISFRFAMEGAIVLVCGRNIEKINSVIQNITENKGKAFPVILDVTDANQIEKGFDDIIKKYGKIDILVNNAGGSAREKNNYIHEQSIEVIDSILDVNLRGTILCARKAAQYMVKQKCGKIINISSIVGIAGLAGLSEYAASKAGIIGFTKSLAMELAKYNINVNCITPGFTNQIIWDKGLPDFSTNKNYIGIVGKTDDIANAVEFFASDQSNFIIGQNLIVDGGRSLGLKGQ